MIKTIDIRCNAANPNMALPVLYSYVNSYSSVRIIDVPKKIGTWEITKVFINAVYPDGMIVSKECVKNGSAWVGTITPAQQPGPSYNGYQITASGVDENNQPVSNYILGTGTIIILDTDGTIVPGQTQHYMHMISSQPDTGTFGTVYIGDNINVWSNNLSVFDGVRWREYTTPVTVNDQITAALTNYYPKNETSSNIQLSNAFALISSYVDSQIGQVLTEEF